MLERVWSSLIVSGALVCSACDPGEDSTLELTSGDASSGEDGSTDAITPRQLCPYLPPVANQCPENRKLTVVQR